MITKCRPYHHPRDTASSHFLKEKHWGRGCLEIILVNDMKFAFLLYLFKKVRRRGRGRLFETGGTEWALIPGGRSLGHGRLFEEI